MDEGKKSIQPTEYVIDFLEWTAKLDLIDNDEDFVFNGLEVRTSL